MPRLRAIPRDTPEARLRTVGEDAQEVMAKSDHWRKSTWMMRREVEHIQEALLEAASSEESLQAQLAECRGRGLHPLARVDAVAAEEYLRHVDFRGTAKLKCAISTVLATLDYYRSIAFPLGEPE